MIKQRWNLGLWIVLPLLVLCLAAFFATSFWHVGERIDGENLSILISDQKSDYGVVLAAFSGDDEIYLKDLQRQFVKNGISTALICSESTDNASEQLLHTAELFSQRTGLPQAEIAFVCHGAAADAVLEVINQSKDAWKAVVALSPLHAHTDGGRSGISLLLLGSTADTRTDLQNFVTTYNAYSGESLKITGGVFRAGTGTLQAKRIAGGAFWTQVQNGATQREVLSFLSEVGGKPLVFFRFVWIRTFFSIAAVLLLGTALLLLYRQIARDHMGICQDLMLYGDRGFGLLLLLKIVFSLLAILFAALLFLFVNSWLPLQLQPSAVFLTVMLILSVLLCLLYHKSKRFGLKMTVQQPKDRRLRGVVASICALLLGSGINAFGVLCYLGAVPDFTFGKVLFGIFTWITAFPAFYVTGQEILVAEHARGEKKFATVYAFSSLFPFLIMALFYFLIGNEWYCVSFLGLTALAIIVVLLGRIIRLFCANAWFTSLLQALCFALTTAMTAYSI